jgi:hypothetical protein
MTPPQWFAPLPSGFMRAPKVGILRAEFGAAGVAIPATLLAEAEAQKQMGGRRGVVRLAYADLAYLSGTDAETARAAVERWVELGEMVDAEFGAHSFTATWKDWSRWQPVPAAVQRDRARALLRTELAAGRVRPTAEVERLALSDGISVATLDRARKDEGVIAERDGDQWVLSLPRKGIKGIKDFT